MPGMFPSMFSWNQRSCCSWLSQISETVNLPLSTKATWNTNPGWVFSFSTSAGDTSSYCDGVIPATRWRMSTDTDCSLCWMGARQQAHALLESPEMERNEEEELATRL